MKKVLSLLLSLVLLLSAASCGDGPEPLTTPSNKEQTQTKLHYTYCDYINDDSVVVRLTAPDESLYYRDLLKSCTPDLSGIYDEIVYAASHLADPVDGSDNVSLVRFKEPVTQEQLDRVYICIVADHPELWYLRTPGLKGIIRPEDNSMAAYLTYAEPIAAIPDLNTQVLEEADRLWSEVAHGLVIEEDIVSALCGYLAENSHMGDDEINTRASLSMKEVLLEKTGTCLSNTLALNFMLQKSGVPAFLGLGGNIDNTYLTHFWTITTSGGSYRYTDVYFMGQNYNSDGEPISNFLLNDDLALLTRKNVVVCKEVPLPGTAVGSGSFGDGLPIEGSSIKPTGVEAQDPIV